MSESEPEHAQISSQHHLTHKHNPPAEAPSDSSSASEGVFRSYLSILGKYFRPDKEGAEIAPVSAQ